MKTEKKILMGLLIILGLMSLGGIAFYLLLTPEVAGKLFTFDGSIGPDKRGLLELAKLVMLAGSLFLFSLSLFALFMLRQNKLTEIFNTLEDLIGSVIRLFQGPGLENKPKRSTVLLVSVLALGLIFRLFMGDQKAYLHLDETISLSFINSTPGLTSGVDNKNIGQLTGERVKDIVSIDRFDRFHFQSFQLSLDKDPHPPLYYWFLHSAQVIFGGGAGQSHLKSIKNIKRINIVPSSFLAFSGNSRLGDFILL